jgi:hypothetical protein
MMWGSKDAFIGKAGTNADMLGTPTRLHELQVMASGLLESADNVVGRLDRMAARFFGPEVPSAAAPANEPDSTPEGAEPALRRTLELLSVKVSQLAYLTDHLERIA